MRSSSSWFASTIGCRYGIAYALYRDDIVIVSISNASDACTIKHENIIRLAHYQPPRAHPETNMLLSSPIEIERVKYCHFWNAIVISHAPAAAWGRPLGGLPKPSAPLVPSLLIYSLSCSASLSPPALSPSPPSPSPSPPSPSTSLSSSSSSLPPAPLISLEACCCFQPRPFLGLNPP